MTNEVKRTVTLTDTQLDLLSCIAERKQLGLPVAFVKHLKPESREGFDGLVKQELLRRSGEKYIATPDAYLTLEMCL